MLPLPVPLAPLLIVIQLALLTAVRAQLASLAVTLTLPPKIPAASDADVEPSPKMQVPA